MSTRFTVRKTFVHSVDRAQDNPDRKAKCHVRTRASFTGAGLHPCQHFRLAAGPGVAADEY